MKDEIQYIRGRVDSIADVLARNTVVLEKNTESLQEHMRRTEILEEQMDTALIPIKVGKVAVWVVGILSAVATVVGAALQYYHW